MLFFLFRYSVQFSSVQYSVVSDSLRPHESQHARPLCPSPIPRVHSRLTSIKSVMPSSHLILCRPLLLLPLIPPRIRVFSNESTLRMRRPKYLSFSFSISPSKEHPRLISFRMDWLDLLAVQGTLKSLLKHHNYSTIKRNKFGPFVEIWMDVETVIQNEVSQKEKQITYINAYMQNLEKWYK